MAPSSSRDSAQLGSDDLGGIGIQVKGLAGDLFEYADEVVKAG